VPAGLELASQLSDDVETSCSSGLHESRGKGSFDRIRRRLFRCGQSQNLEWLGVVLRRANSGNFSTIRDDWSGRSLVFDPPLLHCLKAVFFAGFDGSGPSRWTVALDRFAPSRSRRRYFSWTQTLVPSVDTGKLGRLFLAGPAVTWPVNRLNLEPWQEQNKVVP